MSIILKDFINTLSNEELEELYQAVKKVLNSDLYFNYENLEVHSDYTIITANKSYKTIPTEHLYLELERIRKNDLLKHDINKQIKVKGLISNVRMYSNNALFCLSPCLINGEDIGHTWVRYSPNFNKIKWNSTISFYTEIKRYGDLKSKSGVNWEEVAYVKITGGDNADLYHIPLEVKSIKDFNGNYVKELNIPSELNYTPEGRETSSLKFLKFQDFISSKNKVEFDELGRLKTSAPKSLYYSTLNRELIYDEKYKINTTKETQDNLDKLLLFEWLCKLEDYEFWNFVFKK